MFVSFFPRPKYFFWSAILWAALAVWLWHAGGNGFGAHIGLPPAGPHDPPIASVSFFWSPPFLWFYIYYWGFVGVFAAVWQKIAPHPYWLWSILGSALIAFLSYLQVEGSVANTNWFAPFYDLIQQALERAGAMTPHQFYFGILTVVGLGLAWVITTAIMLFFVSHYVFRWRTAMNDYYMAHWQQLRVIEGAAQRVQEDTMRFSTTTEDMGVSLLTSLMSLIAFLPLLMRLSGHVKVLPIIGAVPDSLVFAVLLWSAFGTAFLALAGIKLPGLNFRNQRVEAAYRKELVFGEDDPGRAQPATISELFGNVRKNYFRLYFNYLYFNFARYLYVQADALFLLPIMGPSILSAALTLGLFQQIRVAFDNVSNSFQYLIQSWPTLVELQSIYKRLRAFEAHIQGQKLSAIEAEPPYVVG